MSRGRSLYTRRKTRKIKRQSQQVETKPGKNRPVKKVDPGRPRRWDAVISRIPKDRQVIGAEIGIWVGDTSWRILAQRENVTHIMIDPWKKPEPGSRYAKSPDSIAFKSQEYFDGCYDEAMKNTEPYADRRQVMRTTSREAAAKISDGALYYVFIDAEHTYAAVKEDIALWLPKIEPGGWIGGHDYRNLPRFSGVHEAVDEAFPEGIEIAGDHTWFYHVPCVEHMIDVQAAKEGNYIYHNGSDWVEGKKILFDTINNGWGGDRKRNHIKGLENE